MYICIYTSISHLFVPDWLSLLYSVRIITYRYRSISHQCILVEYTSI